MGEDVVRWASAVARRGWPSWAIVEYLIRELGLTDEEALFVTVEAYVGQQLEQ